MPQFKINPVITCYPQTETVEANSLEEAEEMIGRKYDKLINKLIDMGLLPTCTDPDCYGIEAQ